MRNTNDGKKVVAIIQAREGGSRLPGKVFKKINNFMVLDYVVNRVAMSNRLDDIILAIPDGNNELVNFALEHKIKFYTGSETDVLSRYYNAAKYYGVDVIVRITADCPCISPDVIDECIKAHFWNGAEYTSNTIDRSYPKGFDVEVFDMSMLSYIHFRASTKYEREHVTPYCYDKINDMNIYNLSTTGFLNRPDLNLCVDTQDDLDFLNKVLKDYQFCWMFSDMELIKLVDNVKIVKA